MEEVVKPASRPLNLNYRQVEAHARVEIVQNRAEKR